MFKTPFFTPLQEMLALHGFPLGEPVYRGELVRAYWERKLGQPISEEDMDEREHELETFKLTYTLPSNLRTRLTQGIATKDLEKNIMPEHPDSRFSVRRHTAQKGNALITYDLLQDTERRAFTNARLPKHTEKKLAHNAYHGIPIHEDFCIYLATKNGWTLEDSLLATVGKDFAANTTSGIYVDYAMVNYAEQALKQIAETP